MRSAQSQADCAVDTGMLRRLILTANPCLSPSWCEPRVHAAALSRGSCSVGRGSAVVEKRLMEAGSSAPVILSRQLLAQSRPGLPGG